MGRRSNGDTSDSIVPIVVDISNASDNDVDDIADRPPSASVLFVNARLGLNVKAAHAGMHVAISSVLADGKEHTDGRYKPACASECNVSYFSFSLLLHIL